MSSINFTIPSSSNNHPIKEYISNEISFPEKMDDLHQTLFPLHRRIEVHYRSLPWPSHMRKVVILTKVLGGKGDIAASAKAISLIQNLCPQIEFDWFLSGGTRSNQEAPLFLNCRDPSKVQIRSHGMQIVEGSCDLLLCGPVDPFWEKNEIEEIIQRKVTGPILTFLENAQKPKYWNLQPILKSALENFSKETDPNHIYTDLHPLAFSSDFNCENRGVLGVISMGIEPGSGIFLDQNRLKATLSRVYCCPSYLLQINDVSLKKDILSSMECSDDSLPDYEHFSFNSGYAHTPKSWKNYIDSVAIHEKEKNVVIVLNQKTSFDNFTASEFCEKIFTKSRLDFLYKNGYGTIILKDEKKTFPFLKPAENPQKNRQFTVILRPVFHPDDMKLLQLASERILATGDNTAAEAWCARCKLYLYENIGQSKSRFLQQQVDLAKSISPILSKLLALFGNDTRLPDSSSSARRIEMHTLLNDPNLSDNTFQFCKLITENYSFEEVLEGFLKRAAWHHTLPALSEIEAEALDPEFKSGLIENLKNPKNSKNTLIVKNLSELGKRVQNAVSKFLTY